MPEYNENTDVDQPIDVRLYIGMLLFRWQTIVLCFLYCLLGGVLYINLAPKKYVASTRIRVFEEKLLSQQDFESKDRGWHVQNLTSPLMRNRVVDALLEQWGGRMGGRDEMALHVNARMAGTTAVLLTVMTQVPEYGIAFLDKLTEFHYDQWPDYEKRQAQASEKLLEGELKRMESRIRQAEDDVIEYQRVNDIVRLSIKSGWDEAYIRGLMSRRRGIETQLMMMEIQFPRLSEANAGVIAGVTAFNDGIGNVSGLPSVQEGRAVPDVLVQGTVESDASTTPEAAGQDTVGLAFVAEDGEELGWPELRYKLVTLEEQEKELAADLTGEHPRLKAVRSQISGIKRQLRVSAELQFRRMQDDYLSKQILRDSLEAAEYKWQARTFMTAQKQAELKRLESKLARYESNYEALYARLQNLRIQNEMNVDRFVRAQATAGKKPVGPEPLKVLLVVCAIGLGSGFGIALVAQFLDNKIQSIRDVEQTIGIPFLGGVPYWVHSGLERTIRPIVTEEHSSGAIEAYRALRTNILTAMNRMNEKILLVTSADSREGKTLTALNMAIMIAQMGKRVLLVDMDLRRGRLHRSLGLERAPGMTDVLKEGLDLQDVVTGTRVENLDLVPTGSSIEDSAELLETTPLQDIFVDVQDVYDYIIIDTSPVLRVTDTVIVASQGLGTAVYVARVNHTPKPLIKYSLEMLKDARVLGLIMNSIEMHKISSLYYTYQYPNYAYYSNAYAYGYNYYQYGDAPAKPMERARIRERGGVKGGFRSVSKRIRDMIMPGR